MARTVETILRDMIGGQAITIAQQVAKIDALEEQIAALKAEAAKSKQTQP